MTAAVSPANVDSPCVAIVDDDASVRRALSRLLRAAGLEGRCFESGDELLAALPGLSPGCVVLDLHMPGLCGLQLQQRLQQDRPGLPVIALTGQHTVATEDQCYRLGAAACLAKPVDASVLLMTIRQSARRYREAARR